MTTKEYINHLETQMNYYKRFDRDMYIYYRNKLRIYRLNTDNS